MSSTINASSLEWLGAEKDQLRIAFTKVFGSRVRAFGTAATHVGGVSDGREGVQWRVAYDPRDGRQWVGVDLEGREYDAWPIARLILRELREISLPTVIRRNQSLRDVGLLWRRDYGQGVNRPLIQERDIAPTPIDLGDLTEPDWHAALVTARDCLNGQRKRLGRATQTVTLANGETVEGKVSPHLTFRYVAPERTEWESFLRDAKARLQPVYDWTVRRAAKPIQF
jgi:hypothetical protein